MACYEMPLSYMNGKLPSHQAMLSMISLVEGIDYSSL